ncbi:hypothetical protein H112_02249 [Trichophyton rubrum D6]|uniref:NADH dehydrogenase [ubiquinone] 1 alpha subcomplex subunit 13 n=3 Tax=Trichophyton TaxID=5550 RepID=F2SU64_TRIRC|nr:uncharacterized protein TERG_06014 [Trichophyton rubrum CBS 118892]EZF25451.1 hypothetical protein H100_02250 [Trichophyton rubrum MR850]EZF44475.1 hypothetical protein H102_02247 [Trichophyton rubrum CBS 100081]EZF55132.1 hypothetical protein H103_02256 [Trichophyton rubrum CBS 288.86]EZF65746.1 hypothetical protein H104_02231 [Trichophyton rubrum CBS 289.86]EZF76379.1 hypothetical protein H105_02266 [Trichophyton soudanense CBS 452.61]EZF87044.1 hypothetical protein H110_02253 [Trichophy
MVPGRYQIVNFTLDRTFDITQLCVHSFNRHNASGYAPYWGISPGPVQGTLLFLISGHWALTSLYDMANDLTQRNVPVRGFRPVYYLIGMHAIMAYGLYKLFIGTRERNELAREKIWSRIHLIPLLQAEEDRDQARRYFADKAREKELLGTDTKIYNSDRFVRPTFMYTPSPSK